MIAWFGFNLHPGHIVVSLDKTVCDDQWMPLLGDFEQLNNQQIQWIIIWNPPEHWITENF